MKMGLPASRGNPAPDPSVAPNLSAITYWREAASPEEMPRLDLPKRCDAIVVGSGYAGLSAALTLARAGRNVHVFEKEVPGEGASTRNGGIASGNIRINFCRMAELFGRERARAIYGEGMVALRILGVREAETAFDDAPFGAIPL